MVITRDRLHRRCYPNKRAAVMSESERDAREQLSGCWAGELILDELHLAEMRAILRAYLASSRASLTALAAETGLTRRRLRTFLAGGDVTANDWERIGNWCVG